MLRVSGKPAVNGMTRIAHRYLAYEEMCQKIYDGGDAKCPHGEHGLASRKEVNTGGHTHADDDEANLTIEIFLDIQRVMTTRYTRCNYLLADEGIAHEYFKMCTAMHARGLPAIGWR